MAPQRSRPRLNTNFLSATLNNTLQNNRRMEQYAQERRSTQHPYSGGRSNGPPRDSRREEPRSHVRPTPPPPSRPRDATPDPRSAGRAHPGSMASSKTPSSLTLENTRDTAPAKRKRDEDKNVIDAQSKKRRSSPSRMAPLRPSAPRVPRKPSSTLKTAQAQATAANATANSDSLITTSAATRDTSFTNTATEKDEQPQDPPLSPTEQSKEAEGRGAVAFISSKQFAAAKQKVAKISGKPLETKDSTTKMPVSGTAAPKKEESRQVEDAAKPFAKDEQVTPKKAESKQIEDAAKPSVKDEQDVAREVAAKTASSTKPDESAKSADKQHDSSYNPLHDESSHEFTMAHYEATLDWQHDGDFKPMRSLLMGVKYPKDEIDRIEMGLLKESTGLPSPPSTRGSPSSTKQSIDNVKNAEMRPTKRVEVCMEPVSREQLLARQEKKKQTFSPTVPNDGGMHKYVPYGDDSVPILHPVGASRYEKLLNKPTLELEVDAVLLLERGLTAEDLGRPKMKRKGPVKIIDDCDLYLCEKKIYVATEPGLLLVSDYLKLAGIPDTTKVRFNGVKPAWAKAFLASSHIRRIDKTTEDPEPERVCCYPELPPGHVGIKCGYYIQVFGAPQGKMGHRIAYGRNMQTNKFGLFYYDEHTSAKDAPYRTAYWPSDDTPEQMEWDGVWCKPQQQKLIDAEKAEKLEKAKMALKAAMPAKKVAPKIQATPAPVATSAPAITATPASVSKPVAVPKTTVQPAPIVDTKPIVEAPSTAETASVKADATEPHEDKAAAEEAHDTDCAHDSDGEHGADDQAHAQDEYMTDAKDDDHNNTDETDEPESPAEILPPPPAQNTLPAPGPRKPSWEVEDEVDWGDEEL